MVKINNMEEEECKNPDLEEESTHKKKKQQEEEEDDDPLLTYKSFFNLRNYDDTDLISVVACCESDIVSFEITIIMIGDWYKFRVYLQN
jgi:hypothetical protein